MLTHLRKFELNSASFLDAIPLLAPIVNSKNLFFPRQNLHALIRLVTSNKNRINHVIILTIYFNFNIDLINMILILNDY